MVRILPGLPHDWPLEAPSAPHEKYGSREGQREDGRHESRGVVARGYLVTIVFDESPVMHNNDDVQAPQSPGDRYQTPDTSHRHNEP